MTKSPPDEYEALRTVVETLSGFDSEEQERILRWAREKVGLSPLEARADMPPARTPERQDAPPAPAPTTNIRSFIEEKKPASDPQFAAAVAYFYRFLAPEKERKDTITAEDIKQACRLANRPHPKAPGQTLVDASVQGLLDRKERGTYAINTVGENLVAMALPSETARVVTRSAPKKSAAKKKPTTRKPAAKKTIKKSRR